jgi:hypothetical protein
MSCYFRHLKEVFEEAGLKVTPANRKEVDRVIHAAVGLTHKHCPSAWKKVKQEFLTDEKRRRILVRELKKSFGANK